MIFLNFKENLIVKLLSRYYLRIALNAVLEHLENQHFLRRPTMVGDIFETLF